MIHSMTAYGSARVDTAQGTLTVEIRSVNSRFLDAHFKLPDELRRVETPLRDKLTRALARGKVELRASYVRQDRAATEGLDPDWLASLASQYEAARQIIPDLAPPRLVELLNWPGQRATETFDTEMWENACLQAADQAIEAFQAARAREGARLAQVMLQATVQAEATVAVVQSHLPQMLSEHRDKLAQKLRDSLNAAFPSGFATITAAEIFERVAQETALFSLRIDVAEELARLGSHFEEMRLILQQGSASSQSGAADGRQTQGSGATAGASGARTGANKGARATPAAGSTGKRIDFLLQEMNREANTLGSKAGSLTMTNSAIELKLLIEQMREQTQNIE